MLNWVTYIHLPGRVSGQLKDCWRKVYVGGLSDFWIPGHEVDELQNYKGNTNMELVSDLINEDSRTWKADILIPLARSIHDDFQSMGGEPSGTFSVRSAYKLLQKSTRIPMWKISWNYIPTFANLKLKRVIAEAWCPKCRQTEEDSNHVFRTVPYNGGSLETFKFRLGAQY
ncbi:hypothetical protein EPI10_005056 [Gossypium australe]|uniref:Uncharacterized protein n=1 Tax=Gossypium australe TaxID=47621 RepID=A0A5B6WLS6_9ROSI|nr:hypothetical protein EPI10_005056 [Gossypium australe]